MPGAFRNQRTDLEEPIMDKDPKKIAVAESAGTMTDDDWPIGLLPDGSLNIVDPDDPPFEPTVVDCLIEPRPPSYEAGGNDSGDIDFKVWRALLAELRRLQAQAQCGRSERNTKY